MLCKCFVAGRSAVSGISGRASKRSIQQYPDISNILDVLNILDRLISGFVGVASRWIEAGYVEPISKVPPRFDRIKAEAITKFLAQLAHMALDDALVER